MAEQRRLADLGEPRPVDVLLSRHPALVDDPDGLLDLIYQEIVLREGRGEVPDPADYHARFPRLAGRLRHLFAARAAVGPSEDDAPTTLIPAGPTAGPPSPAAGWPVLEGYEIAEALGEGGMGIVYRASDRRRGVSVAVKTIRRADPSAIHRFKREFRALLDVSHPNLVTLHELISDGRTWFIVMEYVEGVDFLRFVRGGRPMPSTISHESAKPGPAPDPTSDDTITDLSSATGPTTHVGRATADASGGDPEAWGRVRRAFLQLAEGLAAVHRAGKLHRDIKPSNVLVTPAGRVVVMDFGLATDGDREVGDGSTVGGIVGTPAYMAPEQASGHPVGEACDWYSVGVMLYEVLTGRLPFRGRMLDILMDKQRFEPPAPGEVAAGVPDDLGSLCVELLRREPARRPAGPEILRRFGAGVDPASTIAPPISSAGDEAAFFVGREAHRADLADALGRLALGRPVVVFIGGASGFGKSSLVREFLRGLGDDALALSGRCHERESMPYKALDGLVDALARHLRSLPDAEARAVLPRDVGALARVFPAFLRVASIAGASGRGADVPDPRELRRKSSGSLRELLARIGDRRRLVLWIDDLQWGDSDSLAILSEILRPPDPPVLLLLCSYRSEEAEATPFLRAIRAGPWEGAESRDLEVGPLATADATALALRMLGPSFPSADRRAGAIARESGGNPFFVAELARSILAGGPVPTDGATPVALDGVLWSRISRLPAEALDLLRSVAVSGRPLPLAVARLCLPGPEGDERSALATLRAGRMIRAVGGPSTPEGDRIETYHDRIREAVVARMAPRELSTCHRRLALALEAVSGSDFEALGVHFRGAGELQKAGGYFAKAAARAAEALAFDRAATLYRLAVDLGPGGPCGSPGLRVALGDALANAGRGAEAAAEYLADCRGMTVAEALESRRKAAMQLLISGHIDRGLATLRNVLQAVGLTLPRTPRQALMSLLVRRALLRLRGLGFRPRDSSEVAASVLTRVDVCWSAGIGLSNVDWVRGADFHARGLLLALRAGEPGRVGRALAVEAAQSATVGVAASRRTARLLARARDLSGGEDRPYGLGMVTLATGVSSYLEGRWRDSVEACDGAERIFRGRCSGVAWELDTAHAYALWSLSHLGRWAELSRRLPVLIAEARERGDLYAAMNLSTYSLTIARLAADRAPEAREEVRRVISQWSSDGYHVQHNDQVWASILIQLYLGEGAEAWSSISRHWPTLARSLLLRVQFIRVAMLGVRARSALAAAAGSDEPTSGPWLRSAAKDAARLGREGMTWARAQSRLILASLAAFEGRDDRALGLLVEARGLFFGSDMVISAAVVDRRIGQTIGGDEGDSLIDQADARMAAEGIVRPGRVAALFAPGPRRDRGRGGH